MPPLAALLATPAGNSKLLDNIFSNHTPALNTEFGHKLAYGFVFFWVPDSPVGRSGGLGVGESGGRTEWR